jgi:tryptophan synthase alpha chain
MTSGLDATFAALKSRNELGLFPYLTVGFPDLTASAKILAAIAEAGSDGIELGFPFSDPLADGVTLQKAGARALEGNVTLADAFTLVRGLRAAGHALPVFLMSYANPLLAYGFDRFCRDAAAAGMAGVIVPDVPLEEAPELQATCARYGLDYILFAAPTSDDERLAQIGSIAKGFVYCVALVGTTGARSELSNELPEFLVRARRAVRAPLVVGFGISTPDHVAALRGHADGAIVASAIADLIEKVGPDEAPRRVGEMVAAFKARTRPE